MKDTLLLDTTPNAALPAIKEGVTKLERGQRECRVVTGPVGERCIAITHTTPRKKQHRFVTVRPGCHLVVARLHWQGTGLVTVYRVLGVQPDRPRPHAHVTRVFTVNVKRFVPAFQELDAQHRRFEDAVSAATDVIWHTSHRTGRDITYTL